MVRSVRRGDRIRRFVNASVYGCLCWPPFSASLEGQVILPLNKCRQNDAKGPLIGLEGGIGGSKAFVGYGDNGDSTAGWIKLHGGASARLAYWNVTNRAFSVEKGHYWGPEVQVAILLGLRHPYQ
jgi:hypothetical protein